MNYATKMWGKNDEGVNLKGELIREVNSILTISNLTEVGFENLSKMSVLMKS